MDDQDTKLCFHRHVPAPVLQKIEHVGTNTCAGMQRDIIEQTALGSLTSIA